MTTKPEMLDAGALLERAKERGGNTVNASEVPAMQLLVDAGLATDWSFRYSGTTRAFCLTDGGRICKALSIKDNSNGQ